MLLCPVNGSLIQTALLHCVVHPGVAGVYGAKHEHGTRPDQRDSESHMYARIDSTVRLLVLKQHAENPDFRDPDRPKFVDQYKVEHRMSQLSRDSWQLSLTNTECRTGSSCCYWPPQKLQSKRFAHKPLSAWSGQHPVRIYMYISA